MNVDSLLQIDDIMFYAQNYNGIIGLKPILVIHNEIIIVTYVTHFLILHSTNYNDT